MTRRAWATRDAGVPAGSLENPSTSLVAALTGDLPGAGRSYSGEKAMRVITVFASVRILAESLGQTPWLTYRINKDERTRAPELPLFGLLHEQPNPAMTAQTWKETAVAHTALWGNHYSLIDRGPDGMPRALWPMHPGGVKPILVDIGGQPLDPKDPAALRRAAARAFIVWFQGRKVPFLADEIFHVTGLSLDGLEGLSPIAAARSAIASLEASSEYFEGFWERGAIPGGALVSETKLQDEAAERIRAEWDRVHRGARNSFKVALLHGKLRWENIGMPPQDAMFVDQHRLGIAEIARIFRIQPHKLGELGRATWGNIEHEQLNFLVDTLQPWMVRFESAANRDLDTGYRTLREAGVLTEFLGEHFLRTDARGRWDAYTKAVTLGAMTRGEVRRRENLPPLPGDELAFKPVNVDLLDAAGQVIPRPANQPRPVPEPSPASNA